ESTERSQVLEKLFPVGLHERITEIAKARTQGARLELSVLDAEISRLEAELGEEPDARLAALKGELETVLGLEARVMGEAAARERALEREKERAARAAKAQAAANALASLEERGAAEESRAARLGLAKAAASAAPFALAFSKAKAAALDLSGRAALLSEELRTFAAARPAVDARRARIGECASLIQAKRQEVFGLGKAVEVWNRRAEALEACAGAERFSLELDGRYANEIAGAEAFRREIDTLKPKPDEEALLRADLERLQSLSSGLAVVAEQIKRRSTLFVDYARAEKSRRDYEIAHRETVAAGEKAASDLAAMEAVAANSEAFHLAGRLLPGEPCPVCGSREHPSPAALPAESGSPSFSDIESARARRSRFSADAAGLAASLVHAGERLDEIGAALDALGAEMGENVEALGAALSEAGIIPEKFSRGGDGIASWAARLDEKATASFGMNLARFSRDNAAALSEGRLLASRFEARRREAAASEKILAQRAEALETLRVQAEKARAELAAKKALLLEAERESGQEDPTPRHGAALKALEALEREKSGLEAECSAWEENLATTKALSGTIEREKNASIASLWAEFSRLAESLSQEGFLPEDEKAAALALSSQGDLAVEAVLGEGCGGIGPAVAQVQARLVPPGVLAAEERAVSAYRESLAAARALATSLEADLPLPGRELPDMASLEAALREAQAALEAARERSDACRLSIGRLEETLARRSALLLRRDALEAGSRSLYRLSELLRGEIPGKRLTFKNFVLAMYFREVTRRASVHLSRMSDGRYYLKPEEGPGVGPAAGTNGSPASGQPAARSSGRGKIGLGLRVLDSWTGLDRPTTTLSGGEKFLTSISLALGLADSIRDQNGGVSLDAVFIDEGFGSLDDETLDRAISVLDKIRGSRVIGIVSHVGALRSRIPACIVVEKTPVGSRLSQSAMASDEAQ
ncbi:MAG: SbcC/MukB-like Walker B domain-containing protein, partial [Candidatus Hydrogenedentales bacterium]